MSNAFKLRNGTILLSTEAPGGIYNAAQLKKIASICEGDSVIVKATEDHRLALCVKPEDANTVAEELKAIGLGVRNYQDGLHAPISCIGELCPDNEQDALTSAMDISKLLSKISLTSPLKIGINGCAKCCVPCHTLDLSIIGDLSGYRISIAGKNSQLPEMATFLAEGVPNSKLPEFVSTIIEIYSSNAQNDESLHSLVERIGPSKFIEALSPYSQDAASSGDPFGQTDSASETQPVLDEKNESEQLDDSAFDNVNLDSAVLEEVSLDEDFDTSTIQSQSIHEMDIDPQANATAQDVTNEVEITGLSDSIKDIELNDDFEPETIEMHAEESELILDDLSSDDLSLDSIEDLSNSKDLERNIPEIASNPSLSTDLMAISTEDEQSLVPASDAEEEAYELEINASIQAQGELIEDTTQDSDREEALEILNDAVPSLDDDEYENDTSTSELIPNDTSKNYILDSSKTEDHDDSDENHHLHSLPLSELVRNRNSSSEIDSGNDEDFDQHNSVETSHDESSSDVPQWGFSSLDIDAKGRPVIGFANGVQLTLTPNNTSNQSMQVGGHVIRILETRAGLEVYVDSMKLLVPHAA